MYHVWPSEYAVLEQTLQLKHGMNTQFQVCVHIYAYKCKNIYVDASLFLIYTGPRRGSPSRGIPNYLMESNNQTAKLDPHLIPTPEEAMRQYEAAGGCITHFSSFGVDPIANDDLLIQERSNQFQRRYPTVEPLFHQLVNGDDRPFCDAIHFFIHITQMLQQTMVL